MSQVHEYGYFIIVEMADKVITPFSSERVNYEILNSCLVVHNSDDVPENYSVKKVIYAEDQHSNNSDDNDNKDDDNEAVDTFYCTCNDQEIINSKDIPDNARHYLFVVVSNSVYSLYNRYVQHYREPIKIRSSDLDGREMKCPDRFDHYDWSRIKDEIAKNGIRIKWNGDVRLGLTPEGVIALELMLGKPFVFPLGSMITVGNRFIAQYDQKSISTQ